MAHVHLVRISDCKQVVLEPDGTLTAVRVDVVQRSLEELAHPQRVHAVSEGAGI